MKMKKFNSLNQLLSSEEFKKKDLSYCDISEIDLSIVPTTYWKEFIFDHTNFKNTNIKFYPELLRDNYKEYKSQPFYLIEYCDFTNCDLSYLTTYDMVRTQKLYFY